MQYLSRLWALVKRELNLDLFEWYVFFDRGESWEREDDRPASPRVTENKGCWWLRHRS